MHTTPVNPFTVATLPTCLLGDGDGENPPGNGVPRAFGACSMALRAKRVLLVERLRTRPHHQSV